MPAPVPVQSVCLGATSGSLQGGEASLARGTARATGALCPKKIPKEKGVPLMQEHALGR